MITKENSIPSYSSTGLAARDIFWDLFNDVNFYVEDIEQENLYFEILGRLFPSIKINQIFPLGGKGAVKNHASDLANIKKAHKSIYILDKDFDDLLGIKMEKSNVFYLNKYCIENLLIEKIAILQIAIECDPKTKREVAEEKLDIENFILKSLENLAPLFCMFFVVQYFNLGIKNCESKPEEFSKTGSVWDIDIKKIEKYNLVVLQLLLDQGKINSVMEYDVGINKIYGEHFIDDTNISGKFLLALLFHYLRAKVALGNVSLDSLMYRLACNGTLVNFIPLKRQVIAYLESTHVM